MTFYVRRFKNKASPVAQWLRPCLPVRGTQAWSDSGFSTCRGATRPVRRNCWVPALEPSRCNQRALVLQLLKPAHPKASAPRWEKPPQWAFLSWSLPAPLWGTVLTWWWVSQVKQGWGILLRGSHSLHASKALSTPKVLGRFHQFPSHFQTTVPSGSLSS